MRRVVLAGGVAGMLTTVALAACFSDRAGPSTSVDALCLVPLTNEVPGSTVVVIRNFGFAPLTVRVRAGTTVTWVNCEPPSTESHTTTADQGAWSSLSLVDGQTFSHTFTQPGQFAYHCVPHPFMTGTIIVE